MGYLFHIFIAICILGSAEAELVRPVLGPMWGFALLPVPYLLVLYTRRVALAGRFQLGDRLLRLQNMWGVLAYAFSGLVCGQIAWIRDSLGIQESGEWPTWSTLAALVPFVLWHVQGLDAHSRSLGLEASNRKGQRSFQVRLFLAALSPVLLYIAICAVIGRSDVLRTNIERVGLFNAFFVVLLLGTLTFLLPFILSRTWETESIGRGPMREMMTAIATRAGFRARDLRIWHTGHTMMNAAIIGVQPSSRVVFFSDALLSALSPRELAAVLGHEMGHAARHHVLIFMGFTFSFFVAAMRLTSGVEIESAWLSGGLWTAIISAWALAFGWLSRRYELDADIFSLEVVGDGVALITALEKAGGRQRETTGWRHFSTAARVRFVVRAMHDPDFARAFARRWRWIGRLGIVVALAAATFELQRLAQEMPEDRVVAELCLGRYAGAAERAEALELDEELAALVEQAATYSGGQEPVELGRLLDDLDRSLELAGGSHTGPSSGDSLQREWRRALSLSQLAGLRGGTRLFELSGAIDEAFQSEDGVAAARESWRRLRDSLPGWREWLAAQPR